VSYKNLAWFTIGNTPSTSGNFTVGSAVDSLHVTLGASDDGLSFSARIFETGVGSEVRTGCTYTHGTTTLTRGTLESSTSGSALSFTSAAQVQILGATAVSAASVELPLIAGPNANTSLQAGRSYVVDAASLTATRTYTLPATAKAGERVQIMLSSGSASYAVIITAASGDTLNGVAGGTEWSRLFIAGEVVTLRCVAESSAWVVDYDGRIAQSAKMHLSTSADGESSGVYIRPTAAPTPGAWTSTWDNASINVPASDRIAPRRTGRYQIVVAYAPKDAGTAGQYANLEIRRNGATVVGGPSATLTASNVNRITAVIQDSISLGDYFDYWYRSGDGNIGAAGTVSWSCTFAVTEIL